MAGNSPRDPGLTAARIWPAWLLLPCALLFSFFLGTHCRPQNGGICIDPYWIDHYLSDYSQGMARRGLLGELHRRVLGGPLDILGLNVAAGLAVISLIWILGASLRRRLDTSAATFALAALATSPLLSLFYETMGDPLHWLMLLQLLVLPLILRARGMAVKILILAASALLGALVHEASIFLVAPVALLAAAGLPGNRRAFVATLLMMLAVPALGAGALMAALPRPPQAAGAEGMEKPEAVNPLSGDRYVYKGSLTSSYATLLEQEEGRYFGSLRGTVNLFLKPLRVFWVPFWGFILISCCAGTREFRQALLKCWMLVSAASLPLYVIGHDWGRFAIYSFALGTYCACLLAPSPMEGATEIRASARLKALLAFGMIGLAYPITRTYRINGMPLDNARPLALVLVVSGCFILARIPRPALRAALRRLACLD